MNILARIKANGGKVTRDRWTLKIQRGRMSTEAMDWLRQPCNRDALMIEVWLEFDAWAERAAIREFDGGQDRTEAEESAYREVMGC